ncbi:hypothetical protein [Rhizobium sp. BT03]|uniref:hypothetical protein n=1 Tax=Rhizobium sp. BT03 TaxID=3045156 RepID=UPI0024B3D916|nr:hypothetical protein [Rhizobium sp. BT03]WHO75221.1 hypothetical protein QMO80_004316 [Rhizobium sp. BT03]
MGRSDQNWEEAWTRGYARSHRTIFLPPPQLEILQIQQTELSFKLGERQSEALEAQLRSPRDWGRMTPEETAGLNEHSC